MKRWLSSSLVAAAAIFASVAATTVRADVPPEPDYVESCTVANHKTAANACVSCDTYHGDVDKCSRDYGTKGYTRACRTSGASVWSEVWCKAGAADNTPTPAEPTPAPAEPKATEPKAEASKCAGGGAEGMLALGLAGLWVAARARSRRVAGG